MVLTYFRTWRIISVKDYTYSLVNMWVINGIVGHLKLLLKNSILGLGVWLSGIVLASNV